jgi:hypothetical protein
LTPAAALREFSGCSKLTGIVMSKGKGNGSLFRIRCRNFVAPERPVQTRLTRTMGFVVITHSPCAPSSMAVSGEDNLESEDLSVVCH